MDCHNYHGNSALFEATQIELNPLTEMSTKPHQNSVIFEHYYSMPLGNIDNPVKYIFVKCLNNILKQNPGRKKRSWRVINIYLEKL